MGKGVDIEMAPLDEDHVRAKITWSGQDVGGGKLVVEELRASNRKVHGHSRSRFVEATDSISAASRDVVLADTEVNWASAFSYGFPLRRISAISY
jgi:hypothetical protein